MPAISLVVCLYRERDLLARLLREAAGCYDDLVVVHDGHESPLQSESLGTPPAIDYAERTPSMGLPPGYGIPSLPPLAGSIHELVLDYGGRYFEGGRSFQQEPHWPFAWSQARHDWILRLDADEFPSMELRAWLHHFREEQPPAFAGYSCIWPLWSGRRAITPRWPSGRSFLFDRRKVRFFGMAEQTPISETPWEELDLVLHHRPPGKSYGVRNILFRRQAYRWRREIAQSLMRRPIDVPCWRWTDAEWPSPWRSIRRNPLRHSISALVRYPLRQLRSMIRAGFSPRPSACLNPGLHHFMLGLRVFVERRRQRILQ